MQPTPEDRACIEWAVYVTTGHDPGSEIYVLRDCCSYLLGYSPALRAINPSREKDDAFLVALAQAMKLHLGGIELGEVRSDLVALGTGKKLADRVQDHLADVSEGEWRRLRERVRWYADDNGEPVANPTTTSGDT